MDLQYLPWMAALILVALGIVYLNDKTNGRSAKDCPKSGRSVSMWSFIVGIVVTMGIIALDLTYGREEPNLRWIVPLAFVALVLLALLILFRHHLWLSIKSLLYGGSKPRILQKSKDGILQMKCPRCTTIVQITLGDGGSPAFECLLCGERGTWKTKENK